MSDSRLFKILYYLLDKGRATAPELVAEFEVSPRTIYRDVEALSSAGIPIYTEPGRNGGIYLLHDFILDKAILSENEKLEILTAIQSISATGYTSGKQMLTKLSALFNVNTGNWLEVDFSRWGKHACDNSKFELLKTAVIQHKQIKIVYENTNSERSKRMVQPLKLSYKSKEWYLKAFCLEKQDFRTFIPKPYNWKTYGDMNVEFWKKHQNTSLEEAKEMVEKTHNEVLHLAETFSNEELFSKGVYKWTGGSTLGSYFISTTASHYDWAIKKLKAHIKNCKEK